MWWLWLCWKSNLYVNKTVQISYWIQALVLNIPLQNGTNQQDEPKCCWKKRHKSLLLNSNKSCRFDVLGWLKGDFFRLMQYGTHLPGIFPYPVASCGWGKIQGQDKHRVMHSSGRNGLCFCSYISALPNFLSEYLVLKFRLLKRFKGWNAESRKEWKNQRKQTLMSLEEQLETLAVTSFTDSIWQKSTI